MCQTHAWSLGGHGHPSLHEYVQLCCLCEHVVSLPMQIMLGQNQITKIINLFNNSYRYHIIKSFHIICYYGNKYLE